MNRISPLNASASKLISVYIASVCNVALSAGILVYTQYLPEEEAAPSPAIYISLLLSVFIAGVFLAYLCHKGVRTGTPIVADPILADMIDDYAMGLLWHRMFSFFSLFAGTGSAVAGCYFIWEKIRRHFSDPDLASILTTTQGVELSSVLYQWIPYVSLIIICNGVALFFAGTYRRHSEIALYYKNRISVLKFYCAAKADPEAAEWRAELLRSFDKSQNDPWFIQRMFTRGGRLTGLPAAPDPADQAKQMTESVASIVGKAFESNINGKGKDA